MSISEPLVYIVILNWKDPDITLRCVQSFKTSQIQKYKVVLINNSLSKKLES